MGGTVQQQRRCHPTEGLPPGDHHRGRRRLPTALQEHPAQGTAAGILRQGEDRPAHGLQTGVGQGLQRVPLQGRDGDRQSAGSAEEDAGSEHRLRTGDGRRQPVGLPTEGLARGEERRWHLRSRPRAGRRRVQRERPRHGGSAPSATDAQPAPGESRGHGDQIHH